MDTININNQNNFIYLLAREIQMCGVKNKN
jgi:hypothetical protein